LSSTLSNALAAPVGLRLPCSQLRMVSSETSMRREIYREHETTLGIERIMHSARDFAGDDFELDD
jgi:hypothetical protein